MENHGGEKRLFNVCCTIKTSRAGKFALGGWGGLILLALYFGVPELLAVASILGSLTAVSIGYQAFRLARTHVPRVGDRGAADRTHRGGASRLRDGRVSGMARRFPILRTIAEYLRPYRLRFVFAVLQVFLISACELLKPWPLKVIVDNVLGGAPLDWPGLAGVEPRTLLTAACLGLVGLYVLLSTLSVLNNATTIAIGQGMVNDFRRDLYQHIQRLSLRFHSRREVGDLLYRVTSDTYAIQALSMNGVFPIVTAVTLFLGMVTVMLRMDWLLTLIALGVCPLIFIGVSMMNRRVTAVATDARQKESRLYSVTQRGISAIRIVQAFTTEEEEHRRFLTSSTESLQANLRLYVLQTFYSATVNVIVAGGTALVLWVGASHVFDGTLTIGQLLVFTTLSRVALWPDQQHHPDDRDPAGRAGWSAPRPRDPRDRPRSPRWAARDRRRAPARRDPLRSCDVRVRAGSAGAARRRGARPVPERCWRSSGRRESARPRSSAWSGASTTRVGGRVLLDGVDLREYRLRELRGRIAMVLQPALVFPTTLRENIAYGRSTASEEEVARAAHLAQLDGFLARLPEGLDTLVGEQGATVSDGERQRITIARAILRDAPILILDEPTSALDAETEALIIAALRELMRGRTTFVIAHRLSTVRHADQIIVLRDGKVAESGTFDDLVARGGAFTRLYQAQFGAPPSREAAG